MDIEENNNSVKNGKFVFGEVQICKSSEVGQTDSIVFTKTHLYNKLEVGDVVYGYDVKNANPNNDVLTSYKNLTLPDVILVKKKYERPMKRIWMLKRFVMDIK